MESRQTTNVEHLQTGKGRASKNNLNSFSDDWAPTVSKYFGLLQKTTNTKWKEILIEADRFIPAKCRPVKEESAEARESSLDAADDEIMISD